MPVERNNIISFYVNCQMLRLGRERWGFGFRPSATFFLFSSLHELSEADSLHSRYHNQLCLGSEYHHLYKVGRNSVTLRFISECMYLCMSTTRSLSEGVHLEFLQSCLVTVVSFFSKELSFIIASRKNVKRSITTLNKPMSSI